MANYYATTRSNYFRVKDAKAFEAWCRKRSLVFWRKRVTDVGDCYAITADTGDCAGWPVDDPDQDDEFDFTAELAGHLDPRDVAILFEIGAEKLRYLMGVATAVNPDGQTVRVMLDEIYIRARKAFGTKLTITPGTY